jgi:solute carrier family 25, member 33/36
VLLFYSLLKYCPVVFAFSISFGETYGRLISGGAAGTVASCITNPLEVIKTRLQASASTTASATRATGALQIARQIMRTDGVSGFFRGLPPTLLGIIPSRSAYFYAYSRCKAFLDPVLPEGSPPNALISGFVAGAVGNTITNPIWMVRTRMQLEADAAVGQIAYKGYIDVIGTIFKQEGIKGFYRGLQASYWGCTEGAIQFILYEQFKTKMLRRKNQHLRAAGLPETTELTNTIYFWSAAAAKMIASMATYPHEVARTRLREQSRMGIFKYRGMWQTIRTVAKEEGRKGLYGGMGVHLMKVVPNSALMFLTYEVVRGWLSGFTVVEDNI